MAKELLEGLHENLWESLRQIFNTDRVLLGVAYLVNFAAFLLFLALFPENTAATIISLFCLICLNTLICISLRNSKNEVISTMTTLIEMYKDNELEKYFHAEKAVYYTKRYNLWLILVPSLMVFAIVIAAAIKYAT